MLQDTIAPGWAEAFETVLARRGLRPGDTVAAPGERRSRFLA